MLVSGQWTPQKNRFEITQERITFFNEKSKKNTSSNSGRLALFVNAKSLLQIDKQSRFENGVFLLYFNADGGNRPGVDPYGAKETIFYDIFETYACSCYIF